MNQVGELVEPRLALANTARLRRAAYGSRCAPLGSLLLVKKVKSTIYFEKFEKDFSYDLAKKKNKKFLNKTLEEIFTTDELYRGNKLDKFHHNKQQIQELNSDENKNIIKEAKIDIILEKKIGGLFKEYLSSSNFKKDICDLGNKSKKYEEEYIEKYKQYAMNFIENSDE